LGWFPIGAGESGVLEGKAVALARSIGICVVAGGGESGWEEVGAGEVAALSESWKKKKMGWTAGLLGA